MLRLIAWLAALFAPLLLLATPAAAEWRRAESPNFIVHADASEARLRERILLLEDYHQLLSAVTGVEAPPVRNKLNVFILDDAGDLREVRGNLPAGVGGAYFATPIGVGAYVSAASSLNDEVLFHEYAHHFMLQFAPGPYPVWFREGFAEYFMTARLGADEIEFGDVPEWRIRALGTAGWLPMERVMSGGLSGLDGQQLNRFYAQSWLAVHYFYSSAERFAQLQRLLAATASGADVASALQQATGLTPEAFQRTLMNHIRGGRIVYRRMARDTRRAAPPVTIATLPRSANDLMWAYAALHVGQRDDFGRRLLDRVRAIAARHGDDAFARRVLAQAEAMHGDGAAADRLLDALIAASPNDVEPLYWRGMRHLRAAGRGEDTEANRRAAATWFGRAFRADGNHYQTLYRFAQGQRGQPGFVSENNRNILVLAHGLAPQVNEIRMNAAAMLVARREYALAESLLLPLTADPHDGRLARSAQQLLDRARAARDGRAPPPPPADDSASQ
jgi:hypothetical protein